jgi:hypothetical protein
VMSAMSMMRMRYSPSSKLPKTSAESMRVTVPSRF